MQMLNITVCLNCSEIETSNMGDKDRLKLPAVNVGLLIPFVKRLPVAE